MLGVHVVESDVDAQGWHPRFGFYFLYSCIYLV